MSGYYIIDSSDEARFKIVCNNMYAKSDLIQRAKSMRYMQSLGKLRKQSDLLQK